MIIIYTQPGCGKCEVLKRMMIQKKISFSEKPASDPNVLKMLQENRFKSSPVMNADGKLISFDEAVKALSKL